MTKTHVILSAAKDLYKLQIVIHCEFHRVRQLRYSRSCFFIAGDDLGDESLREYAAGSKIIVILFKLCDSFI